NNNSNAREAYPTTRYVARRLTTGDSLIAAGRQFPVKRWRVIFSNCSPVFFSLCRKPNIRSRIICVAFANDRHPLQAPSFDHPNATPPIWEERLRRHLHVHGERHLRENG